MFFINLLFHQQKEAMKKFIKYLRYALLLTWVGGCVSGVGLHNDGLTGAGFMAFVILCVLGNAK